MPSAVGTPQNRAIRRTIRRLTLSGIAIEPCPDRALDGEGSCFVALAAEGFDGFSAAFRRFGSKGSGDRSASLSFFLEELDAIGLVD